MFEISRLDENKIYVHYFNKVYKTTYYILKNEELAKDATHDTFIKAFKNLKNLQDTSKVEAWITTIATRTAIDIYNKNKKKITYELKEEIIPAVVGIDDKHIEIEDYLEFLSPEHRQILVLKYIEDLTEIEIAELLSVKLGTVKSRIYRAKQKAYKQYQLGGGYADGNQS